MRPHQTRDRLRGKAPGRRRTAETPETSPRASGARGKAPPSTAASRGRRVLSPHARDFSPGKVSCSSGSWLNRHLCVKSSWSPRPRSLSPRQLGGPALPLSSVAPIPGLGPPATLGTQGNPRTVGGVTLLIRANVLEGTLPAWPFPTPLHGSSLGSPLWASAYNPAECSVVGGGRGWPCGGGGWQPQKPGDAGHGARRWSLPQG